MGTLKPGWSGQASQVLTFPQTWNKQYCDRMRENQYELYWREKAQETWILCVPKEASTLLQLVILQSKWQIRWRKYYSTKCCSHHRVRVGNTVVCRSTRMKKFWEGHIAILLNPTWNAIKWLLLELVSFLLNRKNKLHSGNWFTKSTSILHPSTNNKTGPRQINMTWRNLCLCSNWRLPVEKRGIWFLQSTADHNNTYVWSRSWMSKLPSSLCWRLKNTDTHLSHC